jgi:RNA polymerase sigma factor (sigma-70 family)
LAGAERFKVVTTSFEGAFDDLFARAFGLARRALGDSAAAEDVAAEAMARAYANWPRIEGLAYRDGWVLKVAANLTFDRLRRHPQVMLAHASPDTDGADAVALRLALSAALKGLPRRQRQAVALRYLGEMSDREVAATLGISLGSVKTHVHRGLVALRTTLGQSFEEVVPYGLDW